MTEERGNAVAKWSFAAIGDALSLYGFTLSLDLTVTGSGLALGVSTGLEIVGVAAGVGVLGGTLALAAAPVILLGLVGAIAADEQHVAAIGEAADVIGYASPGTLLFATFSPFVSPAGDPMLVARTYGPFTDLLTGFGTAGSALEREAAALAGTAAFPGWITDLAKLGNYYSSSPSSASPTPPAGPTTAVGTPGASGAGPKPTPSPAPTASGPNGGGYGPDPGFYPFAPGMGDSGFGSPVPDSDPGVSGTFNGSGFNISTTISPSSPEAPEAPPEPPALPDAPDPPSQPSPPPSAPSPPSDDDGGDDDGGDDDGGDDDGGD